MIMVNDDLDDGIIHHIVINYWHEIFESSKDDENKFLNPNGWLSKPTPSRCNANVICSKIIFLRLLYDIVPLQIDSQNAH
jgi:hypothetical protein